MLSGCPTSPSLCSKPFRNTSSCPEVHPPTRHTARQSQLLTQWPGLDSSLSSLSLSTKPSSRNTTIPFSKAPELAESWDAADSDTESSPATSTPSVVRSRSPPPPSAYPSAPPPTPVAPQGWQHQAPSTSFQDIDFGKDLGGRGRTATASASQGVRPEKTNAVASRLIAGALGVKAPRRTEEQRAYDKAMRDKEEKKRTAEREQKRADEERRERAKRDIWDSSS